MGLIDAVVEFILPGYTAGKIAEATSSAGVTIDPDDDVFRRLTGGKRDLSDIETARAQAIALFLWRRNPMAHRLTELIADFVVGDGITFEATDPDVQEVLDEFWKDPKMNLHIRHRDLVRDGSLYGEESWEVVVNEQSGRVRLWYIDPSLVKDVLPNPKNALEDAVLVIRPDKDGSEPRRLTIINFDDEKDPLQPVWEGQAFYSGINRVTGQHRGVPDLLAVADFVDGYDQLLFNALERSGLINAFIYDVTLQGASETQVKKWVADHGAAPPPGAVRAHNDKELWKVEAPGLANADMMALGRPVKNMALGGLGAPEAWFAEGDSANRATLEAQGDPTYRMITSRQTVIGAKLTHIFGFVIAKAVEHGRLPAGVNRDFRVILPEPSTADTTDLTTALQALATSLTAAEEQKWVSKATARAIFATIVSGLGIEVDPSAEADKIEDEALDAEQEALDNGLPSPDQQNAIKAGMVPGMGPMQPVAAAPQPSNGSSPFGG